MRTYKAAVILAAGVGFLIGGIAQEKKSGPTNFYENSLHYTNRGLEFWYSKEQGGLERITGIPFSELACTRCHVRSCDTCHKKNIDGRAAYSLEPVRSQEVCQDCHNIAPLADFLKKPDDPAADVHFKKGMQCMDCHTAREVHGDGTAYTSIQDEGAMDARCENCHEPASLNCPGLNDHDGRLACNACHVRDLPSCYNCHFDSRVKEGQSLSLPIKNLLFLINHDGKVTLGNLHTFVYQDRTMITFAPSFPHLIMKEGRTCGDCHGTRILQEMKTAAFRPIRFENGEIKNVQGIIPVLEGQDWGFVFLNFEDGRWVPIDRPAEPLINYAGYSSPLSQDQVAKLENVPARK